MQRLSYRAHQRLELNDDPKGDREDEGSIEHLPTKDPELLGKHIPDLRAPTLMGLDTSEKRDKFGPDMTLVGRLTDPHPVLR